MKRLLPLACAALAAAVVAACATGGPSGSSGFVDLATLDPLIQVELRYGLAANPLGRPLFTEKRALLLRPAAEALARASKDLYPRGYLLFVLDAYRPESIDRALSGALPAEKRLLSAAGAETDHSRGCAVDVSLWDPADKKEAVMTSAWGDASGRSASNDMTASVNERYRREQLVEIMRKNGFEEAPTAWWHWEYQGCRTASVLDVPFSRISTPPPPTPTPSK
jgi:D-alanyl-D-alanine dipeptidase